MHVKHGLVLLPVWLATAGWLRAQPGGESTYGFLNLTPSPQAAALGGKPNAIPDESPAAAFYNPALLDSASDNYFALNYVHYFADINFGYAAYAHSYGHHHFAAGVHYVNYGRFTEADMTGAITGSFTAAEYAFNLTYSHPLPWLDGALTAGVNLKPLLSVFERYSSVGLLADAGFTYRHPGRLFLAALVVRNMGAQLTTYADNGREKVPFEIQLGFSHRLQYAPFRFSLVAQHLESRLGGGILPKGEKEKTGVGLYADEAMRHLILGIECFPFKGLILRGGYNYHRRQEMKVLSYTGTTGFSWGVGIRISRFHIDYARSRWHLAGSSNHFAVNIDLSR
ncbi:MAG: type IX secretion system protein PorQ [Bacteroidales bacterium]|nr:type IX secretion system protein PorQ [Bacteroidales bacterium]